MKYLESEIVTIKSMKLHNFMGIDGELYIDFKDVSEFVGDNGAGKSTVLDALAFVFCYTDAFGEGPNKVNFSHANRLGTETFVEIEARMDNINTILKRNFSVSPTGKQSTNLFVDHREIKMTEWKKMYDKDIFLSLINPKYISSLSTSQVKDLLLKFMEMKDISVGDIVSELDLEAVDFLMEELEEQDIDVVKAYYEDKLKKTKAEKKEKQDTIKRLKLIPEVEYPVDEFNVKGLILTEEAAFETLMDQYSFNPSKENKALLKDFMNQKAVRAAKLEKLRQYKDAVNEIDTLKTEIEGVDTSVSDIEKKLGYIDDFYEVVLKKVNISAVVPDIKFSFKDKLGKEAFEIFYKDVPLKECSFAEQVRAGILISDFLMEYVEINYPIFIDNAECITSLPKLLNKYHQLVSLTVEKGLNLSRYVGNVVEDLKTLETMPRSVLKEKVKTRLLGTDFSESE